jgi:hypothetical protein
MESKKAQIEVTFHWVYILIAGAVILLFFAGIIVRQQTVSEERLGEDVVRVLESILVGAGVSEKTKNFIETKGLMDYTFEFRCEEGYMGFGIKEGSFRDLPTEAVFAPKEIKTSKLILWSLPYNMPYKIMDLLMVTSVNTKYAVIGEGDFYVELEKATEGLNFEFVDNLDEINPGKNFHIRIIDLNGIHIREGVPVPQSLLELGDPEVSAVSFSGFQVTYFQKKGEGWKKGETVQIVSVAGEKDAAKYGAIFAGDGGSYKCNMMKVFKRMKYVNEVYAGKLEEIKEHYKDPLVSNQQACNPYLRGLDIAFMLLQGNVGICYHDYDLCSEVVFNANSLKDWNEKFRTEPCIGLY